MNNNKVLKAIETLDLEPIKTKLMHVSGEGWSRAKVEAMDLEYRRFLYLMHAYPHEETAPTVDVDTFWHYHILDTMKYAADCQTVFGYFMHHYPYAGLDTAVEAGYEERGGDRMRELYEQTFGESYIRAEAYGAAAAPAVQAGTDVQEAGSQAAYCMYRPDAQAVAAQACDVQQAGSQAAYCMYRPDSRAQACDVQQAGSQAAYCMYRPDAKAGAADVQQAGSQAAYCMYRPDAQQASPHADVQQAGAKAAYCMYRPDAAAQPQARSDVQQAGARAAYCMYRPDVAAQPVSRPDVQQAGAKAAYCMYRPDAAASGQVRDVQQAGAKAAYCMYRPDAQAAGLTSTPVRDVQEAGSQAAYCMYRPDVNARAEAAAQAAGQADQAVVQAAEGPLDAQAADGTFGAQAVAETARPAAAAVGKARLIVLDAAQGYRVCAAGTRKSEIGMHAVPVRPAGEAQALPAFTRDPGAAMLRGTPIRPAAALLPA